MHVWKCSKKIKNSNKEELTCFMARQEFIRIRYFVWISSRPRKGGSCPGGAIGCLRLPSADLPPPKFDGGSPTEDKNGWRQGSVRIRGNTVTAGWLPPSPCRHPPRLVIAPFGIPLDFTIHVSRKYIPTIVREFSLWIKGIAWCCKLWNWAGYGKFQMQLELKPILIIPHTSCDFSL